jgi:hypothetical protein
MQTQTVNNPVGVPKLQARLLTDWRPVQLQLVEGATPGKMVLRGEFAKCNSATENKRVYPDRLWEREIRRLGRPMTERQLFGELDHPSDGRTQLARVSHILTNLEIKDGIVYGEAEVLDTERGKNLKALLNAGCKVGVSSRGYGSTRTNEKGEDVVQEDYRLVTFDFVADPADQSAFPSVFYESKGNQMEQDQKMAEEFAKAIEAAKQDGLAQAEANLREEFSREVLTQIASARSQMKEQIRGELLSDPSVGAARTALDKIKDVLRPFVLPEDAQAVAAQKDGEMAKLRNTIAEQNLKIKDLEETNEKISLVAKEAGYKLFVERHVASDPDAELIRTLMGDVTKFTNADELKSKLEAVRADMVSKREREAQLSEQVEREAQKQAERKEKERARVVQQEKALREENGQLRKALDQALEASKHMGVRVYAESRLANHPKASRIRALIESSNPETKKDVDAILQQFRESAKDTDDLEATRARIRTATRGGHAPTPLDEEATSSDHNSPRHYAELGVSLGELRRLSGMGTGLPNSKG